MATINLFTKYFEVIKRGITTDHGPFLPQHIAAAFVGWSFEEAPFIRLSNRRLYYLLHQLPKIVMPPDKALEVTPPAQLNTMWKRERSLNRDVLTVFADLEFRLQHNGLRLRLKYRYHTSEVLCSHGCASAETAKHFLGVFPGYTFMVSPPLPNFWLPRRNTHMGHCRLLHKLCHYNISYPDLWYSQYHSRP